MHHELEGEDVAGLVALDLSLHEATEVGLYPVGGDLGLDRLVGGFVVGEERQVADVALVSGTGAAQVAQLNARHHASSTSTRTWASTSFLST